MNEEEKGRCPCLAVVILHYGKPELARRVQAAFLEADPAEAAHVKVFDNAAPEPFAGAWLRTACNGYWPGALEETLQRVRAEGYSHVWFVNNDIRLVSAGPYLARVRARLAKVAAAGSAVGVWSPAVRHSPYHPQMCVGGATAMGDTACTAGLLPGMRPVRLVDGIAPVYALECVEAVGGLDRGENVYGYGVDMWLAVRAYRAGWPVVVDETVVISHRYHTTAKGLTGFMERAALAEHAYLTERLGPDWRNELERMKHGVD